MRNEETGKLKRNESAKSKASPKSKVKKEKSRESSRSERSSLGSDVPIQPKSSKTPETTMENQEPIQVAAAPEPAGSVAEERNLSSVDSGRTTATKAKIIKGMEDSDGFGELHRDSIQVGDGSVPIAALHIILMFLAVFLPNAVLVGVLSNIGIGLKLYNAVSPTNMYYAGAGLAALGSIILALYYVCGWYYWKGSAKCCSLVLPGFCYMSTAILVARKYPWAPIIMVLFLVPICCGLLRATACRTVVRAHFYTCFFVCSFLCATILAVFWIVWMMAGDHKWEDSTKLDMVDDTKELWKAYRVEEPLLNKQERDLSYSLDCGPKKNVTRFTSEAKTDIGTSCKSAMTVLFTCWASPLIGCLVNLFLGVFALLNGVVLSLKGGDDVSRFESMLKRFLGLLAFIMMGMYFSCSISGASVQLGSTLMAFFASALTVLVMSMYIEIGPKNMQSHVQRSKLSQMLLKAWHSDWARAMFIGAFNLCLPTFLVLNMIKQKVDKGRGDAIDPDDKFTPPARKFVNELKTWNWASILQKVCILGELFFTFQVGVAKATYIFLSWLNTKLASLDYAVVIIIIFFIGYTMFLLPPVPGVPVYVFCGIVVAEQGRQLDSIGFGLGCVIACVLAWALKLAACTGQYFIGFFAGKSVKIQALIGVDKVPTRAIEQILKVPGLSVGKVSVLVGGPDWPTSVTCGILKLNIPQMLLGTAPVFLVSSPCVLAGAFLARVVVGEDSIWSALASTFMGLMAVGQLGCGFMAVMSITKVVEVNGAELAQPRADHEAVAELTRKQAVYDAAYTEVTAWGTLSGLRKAMICLGAACQLLSGFIFAMGGEYCFRPFAVSSSIGAPYEENGLDGKAINIVLPAGWGALGLFAVGCVCHIIFSQDTARLAKKRLAAGGEISKPNEVPDASLIGNSESQTPSEKE